MSSPTIRSDTGVLRSVVVGAGLCWSVAYVAVALAYELELYADGAMFSYAVAAQDVWAFHWHNISGRLSVYFLSLLPAELYVGLSGNTAAGIVVYGLLFYIAPLAGLIGTFATDHSRNRIIFVYACFSTALLGPLVFGFPTEMWLAHALFWPALAASHYAKRTPAGTALVFILLLALAFTHEGALVLTSAIVATLSPRGVRDAVFLRAVVALIVILALSAAVKIMIPPDEYYAGALMRAALHFFDPAIFQVNIVSLLFATLAGYGAIYLLLSRMTPGRAFLHAALVVLAALVAYWLWFDHAIHASSRYYLRTAIVIVTPLLGAMAALSAMHEDGHGTFPIPILERALAALRNRGGRPLAAAFLLLTLVHVIETEKFISTWRHYRAAVAALATGNASDPGLGDPHFVSSNRIEGDLNRLSWFSTTPYLSAIAADFRPSRLVIDPVGNYFWLSCATATANAKALRTVPAETRDLVQIYSCLHR
jgi:hypothetical protein